MKSKIYFLPNLITTLSLFSGCLSMRYSLEGFLAVGPQRTEFFFLSAYAILFAGLFDGLDGGVARLTNSQSSFGVQLDSLCDLLSFGVAPAVLSYMYGLKSLDKLGFAVSFIFVVCGVLRLARFNVQSSLGKANGNFTGIPIPMAAAALCVSILTQIDVHHWILNHSENIPFWLNTVTSPLFEKTTLVVISLLLSLGMVSTFEYLSTKNIRFPKKRPFRVLAALVIGTVLLFTIEHIFALACLLFLYCLHGPLMSIFYKRDKDKEESEIFDVAEEDL